MASKKSLMEVNASYIAIFDVFITVSFWGNRLKIGQLNKGIVVGKIYWLFPDKCWWSNIWFEK